MKKTGIIALILTVAIFALSIFSAGCSKVPKLDKPYGLNINDSYTLTWETINDARSYVISITNENGATQEDTSRRANYALSGLEVGDYDLKVKAVGDGKRFGNSVWSETYYFHRDYETGCLYKLINNNSEYELSGVGTASGELEIEGTYRGKKVTSIGARSFISSKLIEKVVIDPNITNIGDNAFYNCQAMTEVVMPDTISTIGKSAFQSCTSLVSIKLPEGLKSIGEAVFSYCRSLAEIDLTGIESIGKSAFSNCDGIKELVLPDSLTSLGDGAFSNTVNLKSVTFNSGLENLGDNAFAGCSSLTEINFANDGSLKEIGVYTFTECDSLTEVILPEGLQTIDSAAFYGAKNLANVVIPSSVTRVGSNAFNATKLYNDAVAKGDAFVYADNWLVEIARGDDNSNCPNVKMTGIIAETDGENERIPDYDSSVDFGYVCKFKPGVVGIADYAFSKCKELIYAEIPLTVKYIGNFSFAVCDKLYRLSTLSGLRRIGTGAFYKSELLQQLYLSEGLEFIGNSAFSNCTALVNPTNRNMIPQSVTQIEPYAFYKTKLWDKEDEYGVVYAGNWIVGYKGAVADGWMVNGKPDIKIKNPYYEQSGDDESVNIADYAFYNPDYKSYMLALQSYFTNKMYFKDYLEYLKNPDKFDFEALNVSRPPTKPEGILRSIDGLENTRVIGQGAFYGCSDLISAYIGDNVKEIRDYTFYGCESLTEVNIPFMLEKIGTSAFYFCKNLRNVVNAEVKSAFPEFEGLNLYGCRVTDIGDFAFYNTAIRDINLGSKIESVGEVAFYSCLKLETVELPDTLSEIKYATFTYCESLKNVKIGANIQHIDDYAFYGCAALSDLKLPDSVKSIGNYTFFDSGLEYIDFGNGLEKIGIYAFASSKLQAIALPDGIQSIGEYAFRDCSELQSVTVSESIQQVGLHAFYGCDNMTAYIQHESKPDGWATMWNSAYRPEVWGCEMSEDGSYVVSVTVGEKNITNAMSIEAYQVTVNAPYRAGYRFGGWTTQEGATAAEYGAGEIKKAPAGTKLYAIWLQ